MKTLIFDAMHIKGNIVYNAKSGKYEGFPDFGDGIISFDSESFASEAHIFMLVGLQWHWKYPRVYFARQVRC